MKRDMTKTLPSLRPKAGSNLIPAWKPNAPNTERCLFVKRRITVYNVSCKHQLNTIIDVPLNKQEEVNLP